MALRRAAFWLCTAVRICFSVSPEDLSCSAQSRVSPCCRSLAPSPPASHLS
jgi:hypothetical protein